MTEDNQRVGFIGVGFMGHGMAKNIVEKGFSLTVMAHRNRTPVEDLISRGAKEVATAKDVAVASDIVFLCVSSSREVEAIIRDPGGLAEGLQPGSIVVDASTSDPTSTLTLAAELDAMGVTLVDAPLGRSPKEAWEGTLDTMVGCDADTFARIKPVLDSWAGRVVHIGEVGEGHKMKLINNFLSLGYGALYAEALTLAQNVGIEPARFDSVIRGSRMDCGFYQTYMKYVLERDRDAHRFTLRNGFKDMRYLDAMASEASMANPLANAVKNTYALAVNSGHGEDYVPMISDVIAGFNATSLAKGDEG
ncbi:NAD(P)-dependent oxidoreductase [Halomonas ramblicola]|uniref:NAD(P)-dependent oxidoreductase n=1 Tax=Halomonas ramblicola TaxID=747349 RepID=UPI0025B44E5C|nr:NAD(P)-dependent oxidoreductase [Halomonas ramblicola]MDN3523173.1 NAD(P)-dependent oxidoreductase [Halomonas ramblicola]